MSVVFEEEPLSFIPISLRPEWSDVVPLHPAPLPHPVVDIASDPAHGDLLAYFWAGMAAGELSQRMLDLCEEIIMEINSAHYSVWEWRWRCVEALGGIAQHAQQEADLMRRVATDNPKNYQLWNYRRKYALALGEEQGSVEMEYSAACLSFDAKNYHAWAHRQAILTAFGGALWPQELEYCQHLLEADVRNNSAWNQRAFILKKAPVGDLPAHEERYDSEFAYVVDKIGLAPNNDSVWAYFKGLTLLPGAPQRALAVDTRFKDACIDVLLTHVACVPALRLLADVYVEQAEVLSVVGGEAEMAAAAQARKLAVGLFENLSVSDGVRTCYYRYRLDKLQGATS